ncbi:hypothetical protein B2J88_35765 [Rhodococcus sp. SRB_17]|nr:hypothetical protein [Rhodococcus sp. SRB_17]
MTSHSLSQVTILYIGPFRIVLRVWFLPKLGAEDHVVREIRLRVIQADMQVLSIFSPECTQFANGKQAHTCHWVLVDRQWRILDLADSPDLRTFDEVVNSCHSTHCAPLTS